MIKTKSTSILAFNQEALWNMCKWFLLASDSFLYCILLHIQIPPDRLEEVGLIKRSTAVTSASQEYH